MALESLDNTTIVQSEAVPVDSVQYFFLWKHLIRLTDLVLLVWCSVVSLNETFRIKSPQSLGLGWFLAVNTQH